MTTGLWSEFSKLRLIYFTCKASTLGEKRKKSKMVEGVSYAS